MIVADRLIPWKLCGLNHSAPIFFPFFYLDTVNKNDSSTFNDVFNPVGRLEEIVRNRETFEIHGLDAEKLDVVRLIEACLGVYHAPAIQAALSGVENCCHPQSSQDSEFSFWVEVTLIGFKYFQFATL